mmetsp:Transcript_24307/g.62673  ORF Transcript_24307/g.62673 Transcript_24307/m.62673 type:complete len:200 (-) Transcript_24307:579-1178(-)
MDLVDEVADDAGEARPRLNISRLSVEHAIVLAFVAGIEQARDELVLIRRLAEVALVHLRHDDAQHLLRRGMQLRDGRLDRLHIRRPHNRVDENGRLARTVLIHAAAEHSLQLGQQHSVVADLSVLAALHALCDATGLLEQTRHLRDHTPLHRAQDALRLRCLRLEEVLDGRLESVQRLEHQCEALPAHLVARAQLTELA